MTAVDEDALLCDMMETYGIPDTWEESSLPVARYATFAAGLRPDSRIVMSINDSVIDTKTSILTAIFDAVNWIKWSRTVDAENGENCPKSLLNKLLGNEEKENGREVTSDGRVIFESSDAFEQELERLRQEKLRGTQNG